ncbi:uncharacterized protein [Littorina saxatilis]|uniref:Uncharacterized protein n=1 Tax=Littorina saxatilis TaxID=31220 RepID=A0AAN9GEE1_9CAEN
MNVCFTCDSYKKAGDGKLLLRYGLEDLVKKKGKKARNTPIEEFTQIINSFLNGRGGEIIIHANDHNHIDVFDQKIDEKLQALVPDDALYQEVYERYFIDKNHVEFRVIPRSAQKPHSTWDFRTKFSVNKGIVDPSHGHMLHLFDIISAAAHIPSVSLASRGTPCFKYDEQVCITIGSVEKPLHENISTQFKAFGADCKQENIKMYCWDISKAYISAFSKIVGGGSVYIGVTEESEPDYKWTEISDSSKIPTDVGSFSVDPNGGFKLWKEELEDQEGNAYIVYHTAKPEHVPIKEKKTGKLIVKGVDLKAGTQEEIDAFIQGVKTFVETNVKREMMWIGQKAPGSRVTVSFHSVHGAPNNNHYVIEIKIDYYHGLCFRHPSGPLLFTTDMQNGEIKKIEVGAKAWKERYESMLRAEGLDTLNIFRTANPHTND